MPTPFLGAIFDVDGVLVDSPHEKAWRESLRELMEGAVMDAGVGVAAASSSENAGLFLRQIRLARFADEAGIASTSMRDGLTLLESFDADVSGRDFAHGKPHPEMFLTAAAELGVAPQHAFVVEDASSGIEAAKAGGMVALGIARSDDEALLEKAGADLVVTTLDDIDVGALTQGRLGR